MSPEQLPLDVGLSDDATFENYRAVGEGGERALIALIELSAGTGSDGIFLHGASGCGRSHLLQACCHHANALGRSAAYLPLSQAGAGLSAAVLDSLEHLDLVAIDDLERVAGDRDWEEGLFHLYNRCEETACNMLWAGSAAPREQGLALPDLASRLSWGLVLRLQTPDDAERELILVTRARSRGMDLPAELARFILLRAPRDMHSLMDMLDRLDVGSLAQGRRLTLPFIKEMLEL